jgi:Flavodoxin domain
MRALIVYESMYGNTHVVADHLAEGLRPQFEVEVVPVESATDDKVATVDLLVVGGPTHVHTLSSEKSRAAAKAAAAKPDVDLTMDAGAEGEGLRDWFDLLPAARATAAAAFDTRLDAAAIITGRASRAIAKRLEKHGFDLVADPESFLVDKQNHLIVGEADRARQWAKELAESVAANP